MDDGTLETFTDKGVESELKRKQEYRQLLRLTRQILNDSRRVLQEVEALASRQRRVVRGLGERLAAMSEQVRAVVRQTKARVFAGVTQFPGKLVSLFAPHTEIIRKGKASKPNEFGKLVRKRRTGSSRTTRSTTSDRAIGTCCCRPWPPTNGS
jgi:IS5 family transposase